MFRWTLSQGGDVTGATAVLGRPHRIQGLVVQGAARGRTLGFPTANLEQVQEQLPAHGVYAGTSVIAGRKYPAAVHVGPNPTFAEGAPKLEVHLLDFAGDLYGQQLSVDLHVRLRDIVKFPNRDALLQQLHQDMAKVRRSVD
jgi:riboflavin kinase/FMN adenylyltransferase